MMVFKRRQIVVLSLILMIVVAGYLQYTYKKGSSSADKDTGKMGEAVYVDSEVASDDIEALGEGGKIGEALTSNDSKDNKDNQQNKDNKDNKTDGKNQKTAPASKMAEDFFAQAKLDKEMTREKDTDALKAITEDENADKATQTKAYNKMMLIIDNAEKEMRIETSISRQGFDEVVALIGDDGSIDVFVKTPSLTSAQTAQIADVVSRQADIDDFNKIHIKPVY